MTPDSIEDKVTEIIANQLLIEKSTVKANSRIREDLKADTLDVVEWILEIENAFGIEISNQDVEKITSVVELVNQVSLQLTPTQS